MDTGQVLIDRLMPIIASGVQRQTKGLAGSSGSGRRGTGQAAAWLWMGAYHIGLFLLVVKAPSSSPATHQALGGPVVAKRLPGFIGLSEAVLTYSLRICLHFHRPAHVRRANTAPISTFA
jgi:hypothetical protein